MLLLAVAVPTIICIVWSFVTIWSFVTRDSDINAILAFLLATYAYLIWLVIST